MPGCVPDNNYNNREVKSNFWFAVEKVPVQSQGERIKIFPVCPLVGIVFALTQLPGNPLVYLSPFSLFFPFFCGPIKAKRYVKPLLFI
jgi:hypothetical protein